MPDVFRTLRVAALVPLLAACAARTTDTPTREGAMLAAGDNRRFTHTLDVDAPPARIWALWMDVARWPAWDTELRDASATAPLAPGVEGRLTPVRGRASRFRVTALVPGERYVFETSLPAATLRIVRYVTPTATGSRFTHEVSLHGPLGRVFASRFAPAFRRALPVAMQRLAALAHKP